MIMNNLKEIWKTLNIEYDNVLYECEKIRNN
jgi:hypothetical protein